MGKISREIRKAGRVAAGITKLDPNDVKKARESRKEHEAVESKKEGGGRQKREQKKKPKHLGRKLAVLKAGGANASSSSSNSGSSGGSSSNSSSSSSSASSSNATPTPTAPVTAAVETIASLQAQQEELAKVKEGRSDGFEKICKRLCRKHDKKWDQARFTELMGREGGMSKEKLLIALGIGKDMQQKFSKENNRQRRAYEAGGGKDWKADSMGGKPGSKKGFR